ncbi:MAG: ribonuclease P protein component [Xenococcaceae cyanobacterium MO_207.B15]|nr:ribonuclease P protein component [Xenococcaceae cyanobacterium MO_207.B15]
MGLRKIYRLKHWRDFRSVYKQGISCYSPNLVLRALFTGKKDQQSPINPSRIGISISTKVSKKAVKRNRIKRQIRGAIAKILPTMAEGWDIVIIVKPSARECKYEHFLRELEQLLIEAKIVNGH